MPENNKYQIPSTAQWEIPGDVPGRSRLYVPESEEDDFSNIKENAKKVRTIASDFYKNQLVKELSEQSQNISQRAKALSKNAKRTIIQPLAILFLVMAGMMLSLSELNDQFILKSNESFAAVHSQISSNNKKVVAELKSNTPQKEIIDIKVENNQQKTFHLKLTDKPVSESKTITHVVVKGDTLWDIAEHYVEDPFRYPELAKLSDIITPDLIYPGNIIHIQV